jgi:hypothetical protein
VITISGQQLVGIDWVTVSPLVHPWRTFVFSFPIVFFAFLSLHFLRQVSSGSTIIYCPAKLFTTFQVVPGKHGLTKTQLRQGCVKSYNGPVISAALGLLLFSASQVLLVLLFKQVEYHFLPLS